MCRKIYEWKFTINPILQFMSIHKIDMKEGEQDCWNLERRFFFYTFWATEWEILRHLETGLLFLNISASSALTELRRTALKSSFLNDHFWNSRIPRKPPNWKPPCRRTHPQGNDPHTISFKDIMISAKTSRRGLSTLQFLQTIYSGGEKI